METNRIIHILILAVSATILAGVADARLYRWVDEDGAVHYSDRVPPAASQRERNELNPTGRVVNTIERARTPEELEEERRQARIREAEQRRLEEQRNYDRVLLQTFTTEKDLLLTREYRLSTLDSQVQLLEKKESDLRSLLEQLTARAEALVAKDEPLPDSLAARLRNMQARLAETSRTIARKREDRGEIEARFAADIDRYRELRAQRD